MTPLKLSFVTALKQESLRNITIYAVTLAALLALMPSAAWAEAPKSEHKIRKAGTLVKEEMADTMLSMKVRVGILEHLKTNGIDVSIMVENSIASLSGQLDTEALRDLAIDVAKNTPGIKDVNSTLTVVPKENYTPIASAVGDAERRMGDSLLEAKVKMKLLEQNGKPAMKVEVKATDGEVRLVGTVSDKARRDTFVNTVESVNGVKKVHDLMKIGK